MIAVCENEKYVLHDGDIKLAEKDTRRLSISLSHVVHQFKAHCEASVFYLTVVVFAGPHAGVDYELELRSIKSKQGREAIQIDCLEQFEKLDTVLWILVEILIDHLQSGFEDAFHYQWYFVFHQILDKDVSFRSILILSGLGLTYV